MSQNKIIHFSLLGSLLAAALFLPAFGCQSNPSSKPSDASASVEKGGASYGVKIAGAATIFALRILFSPTEWDIIVQHMRLRASLTGEESRKIVEFLKAAS